MLVQPLTGTNGLVIKCVGCPHYTPEDSTIEWVDTNGDVFFVGSSTLDLAVFIESHEGRDYDEADLLDQVIKRVPSIRHATYGPKCRCGHPFSYHSFYGETRNECLGDDNDEQCDCGHYQEQPYTGPTIPPAGFYPDTI